MRRSRLPKVVLLLVLILLVAAPSIHAAEPAPAGDSPWGFFVRIWSFLTSVWADNGCEFDPDGRCLPHPGTATNGS